MIMRNKSILTSILVILVVIELSFIFALSDQIYTNYTSIAMIINPIKEENILFPEDSKLENFFELAPNRVIEEQWGERTIVQTTNSDTLHERFEYTIDKPKDTFRIINLGDSFTYGYGLSTQYNYSEVLEDLLNDKFQCKKFKKFEVINLGVSSYDIEYSVERFKRRGQKYNPDLIVWILKDDDFYNSTIMKVLLRDWAFFKDKFGFMPPVVRPLNWDWEDGGDEEISKDLLRGRIDPKEITSLYSINDYYTKSLVFLLYSITSDETAIVEDFAQVREDTYVYKVSNLPDEEVLPNDDHPNKNGHLALANGLFNYFTENDIIPCS